MPARHRRNKIAEDLDAIRETADASPRDDVTSVIGVEVILYPGGPARYLDELVTEGNGADEDYNGGGVAPDACAGGVAAAVGDGAARTSSSTMVGDEQAGVGDWTLYSPPADPVHRS